MVNMTPRPDNPRNRELAAIHIAAQQLGLERDAYEGMLLAVGGPSARRGGKISAGHLDYVARHRVLDHLRACGAQRGKPNHESRITNHGPGEWAWVDKAAEDRRPMLRKIIMLLKSAGRGKGYADGTAWAMFRIERLELCGTRELHAIVTALVKDARRHAMKEPA